MGVEAVEARAMAKRARGRSRDEAKAKAKSKAKVEDAEALTGRTRTRTKTGPGETPTLSPGGTHPEPSEGQRNRGPTTCSKMQEQQEQGAKGGNEDGDKSNPCKRSRFMRIARKLRKEGFHVPCSAEF